MNPKTLLCLALLLIGVPFAYTGTPIPPVETTHSFLSIGSVPNEWSGGRTFSEIAPPQKIKQIILLDDANFRNLSLPARSAAEIQSGYDHLFDRLESSGRLSVAPYLAAYEYPLAQFVIITSSTDVIHVQALRGLKFGEFSGVLISGRGVDTRINLEDIQPSAATNQPANASKRPRPSVETDYLLDQKPGDWAGLRFDQIIKPDKLKRIVLLNEFDDIFQFGQLSAIPDIQQKHQMIYQSLFDRFEASGQNAEATSLSKDEGTLAELVLITGSGEAIYLEIVGTLERLEKGSVVGRHISALLIHGPGKGVRINYNILPESSGK